MAAKDASLDLLTDLIARAKRAGADAADALYAEGASVSHSQRLGKTEKLERAEGRDLGLRVFIGKRQAIVASSDQSPKALADLVERAVAMAKAVPEDPFCGLADPALLARAFPQLDLADADEPAPETLIAHAKAAEEAALAVKGVTNSEGAEAGWSRGHVVLAASNGFTGAYENTRHSVGVAVVAGEGLNMERDYDYCTVIHAADLESPEKVGRHAGERAVRRLGARKAKSTSVPVIYDPRVSNGLVRHLASAINGAAIARGTSFLKDKMGQAVTSPHLTIVDDPHRKRGLGSKPFDGEGVANKRRALVEKGILQTWLLDSRSARQLGLTSTGHAARGTSGPPGPSTTNLYLEAGSVTPDALMADIKSGLYITEMIGMGVNMITGDYSRGAAGFWIEDGKLTYSVNEITVAGNLKDMFVNLTAANDLVFRYGTDAPTLRVDGMTVAGA